MEQERTHEHTGGQEPMREVRGQTTPGTDPRVEELAREQHSGDAPTRQRELDASGQRQTDMRDGGSRAAIGRHGMREDSAGLGGDGVERFRDRLQQAQARFIDDPRRAVEDARSVVKEAIDHFMESVESGVHGESDTEQMRMLMQRYREVFDRVAGAR